MRMGARAGMGPVTHLLLAVGLASLCDVAREPLACGVLQDTDVLFVCGVDVLECPLGDNIRIFDRFVDT